MLSRKPPSRRLTILDILGLTAGVAVGVWLLTGSMRTPAPDEDAVLTAWIFGLGGLSLVGPPLLLWRRYQGGWGRSRMRVGELFWFCQGTASWLLWPPMIYRHVQGLEGKQVGPSSMSGICYFYGTPLMALYIVLTLLAGGWLRIGGGRRRKKARRRSWTEAFGLLLGLAWACTGLYVLSVIYREDLFK